MTKLRKVLVTTLAALAMVMVLAGPAAAHDRYWDCHSGSWSSGSFSYCHWHATSWFHRYIVHNWFSP